MWFFGGAGNKANDESNVSQSPKQRGVVDMTSLDITYITHRLLGELEYSIYGTLRLVSTLYLVQRRFRITFNVIAWGSLVKSKGKLPSLNRSEISYWRKTVVIATCVAFRS